MFHTHVPSPGEMIAKNIPTVGMSKETMRQRANLIRDANAAKAASDAAVNAMNRTAAANMRRNRVK